MDLLITFTDHGTGFPFCILYLVSSMVRICFGFIKICLLPDDLLPHVVDLAVNSSDRQTKVAASELLHSIIILMIGKGKL